MAIAMVSEVVYMSSILLLYMIHAHFDAFNLNPIQFSQRAFKGIRLIECIYTAMPLSM